MKLFEKITSNAAGICLALLACLAVWLFNDHTGLLDTMQAVTLYGEKKIRGSWFTSAPEMNWQLAVLIGTFAGALFSSLLIGQFKGKAVQENAPGRSGLAKNIFSLFTGFAGGFLVMAGIQLSGDSVWGHLTGAIQLASGSWLFLGAVAATGIVAAMIRAAAGKSGDNAGSSNNSTPGRSSAKRKVRGAK